MQTKFVVQYAKYILGKIENFKCLIILIYKITNWIFFINNLSNYKMDGEKNITKHVRNNLC